MRPIRSFSELVNQRFPSGRRDPKGCRNVAGRVGEGSDVTHGSGRWSGMGQKRHGRCQHGQRRHQSASPGPPPTLPAGRVLKERTRFAPQPVPSRTPVTPALGHSAVKSEGWQSHVDLGPATSQTYFEVWASGRDRAAFHLRVRGQGGELSGDQARTPPVMVAG